MRGMIFSNFLKFISSRSNKGALRGEEGVDLSRAIKRQSIQLTECGEQPGCPQSVMVVDRTENLTHNTIQAKGTTFACPRAL